MAQSWNQLTSRPWAKMLIIHTATPPTFNLLTSIRLEGLKTTKNRATSERVKRLNKEKSGITCQVFNVGVWDRKWFLDRYMFLASDMIVTRFDSSSHYLQWYSDVQMGCYTCTSTEELENTCETDPSSLPHSVLKSCPREVCTIVRVEEWPSGRVKLVWTHLDIIW